MNVTALNVNTSAPTIASSAMLVDLHIGFWAGRKKDKAASDEVARLNNAEKGVTSVINITGYKAGNALNFLPYIQ